MTMGFKYQLVSCTHPRELVEVTLNHLDSIRYLNVATGAFSRVSDDLTRVQSYFVRFPSDTFDAYSGQLPYALYHTMHHIFLFEFRATAATFPSYRFSFCRRASVESSPPTAELIDGAIAQVVKLCQEISNTEFALIRQTLAKNFQGKVCLLCISLCTLKNTSRHGGFAVSVGSSLLFHFFFAQHIKVSLFLQDGIQSPDGTIVLNPGGPIMNEPTVEAPGTIRYQLPYSSLRCACGEVARRCPLVFSATAAYLVSYESGGGHQGGLRSLCKEKISRG